MQQVSLLSPVELLHHFPEPLYLWRIRGVAIVIGGSLQVGHVDIWQPRDEQLQLLVGEYGNKVPWNDFIEAVKEGIDLLLDALVQMIVGLSLNIVFLVLVGQVDVSTPWDEVDLLSSSEIIFSGTECLAECLYIA